MAWLTGWNFRKSHIIKLQAGAGTGYVTFIKVYYGSGTDGTETIGNTIYGKVYCNSKCKTDFSDIRFVDSSQVALLSCWMSDEVDSNYAIFWIKVSEDLTTADRTIYIYYGKADASSISNFNDTFSLNQNDHFDDQVVGYTPTAWSTPGAGEFKVRDDYVKHGTKSAKHINSNGENISRKTLSTVTAVSIIWWIRKGDIGTSAQKLYFRDGATEGLAIGLLSNGYIGYYKTTWQNIIPYNADTWYKIECNNFNFTTKKADVYIDDVLRKAGADFIAAASDIDDITESLYNAGNVWIDSIIIRKYVTPEPVHNAWGDEEGASVNITVQSVPTGITYTWDAVEFTTSHVHTVDAGTEYICVMPSKVTIDDVDYEFSMWENGSTSRLRTIVADTNKTVIAYFEEEEEYEAPPILQEIKDIVVYLKKIETNKWAIVNNQFIIYDDDGETPLLTFNLSGDLKKNYEVRTPT